MIAAVLVACLTLTSVLAWGWLTSTNQRASRTTRAVSATVQPVGSWAQGATSTWSTTTTLRAEVFSAGDKVIVLKRTEKRDTKAQISAYTVDASAASQSWSTTTVDLSQGTVSPAWNSYVPADYEFLVWKDTLVHGTTLISLKDGAASTAPWPSTDVPLIADDIAISCTPPSGGSPSGKCTAWKAGSKDSLWTVDVPDINRMTGRGYLTVMEYDSGRHVVLGGSTVVNIDTGERLNLGSAAGYAFPAKDGWGVSRTDGSNTVDTYELDGSATGSFKYSASETPVLGTSGTMSLAEVRSAWTGRTSTAMSFAADGDSGCLTHLTLRSGQTVKPPTFSAASDSLGSGSERCVYTVMPSTDFSVAFGRPNTVLAANTFGWVYSLTTNKDLTFEDIDPTTDDTLMALSPDLLVGYDPDSGKLYGYTPQG